MSDLQIGLIVLGILLIGLVLGYNGWLDWRAHRKMQKQFPMTKHDPLLETDSNFEKDPVFSSNESEIIEEPDPAIEAVIDLSFPNAVIGANLLPFLHSLRQLKSKPLRFFAATSCSQYSSNISADQAYTGLHIAVLLANRNGALTAIEWSQIWMCVQAGVEQFDAVIENPDVQALLMQAKQLDQICAALDMQVGLTLVLKTKYTASDILRVGQAMDFIEVGQRLIWGVGKEGPCFVLSRSNGTGIEADSTPIEALSLLLDVPNTPADPHAFSHMVEVGTQLASRLNADLVDDNGKPLSDETSQSSIDERLQLLFSQLEQAGLPAGSPRASKVFS